MTAGGALAVSLLEPEYDGREGYWTSEGMDWLLYASHEGSITVAGDWLLEAVKSIWPAWRKHLYTGWDRQPPPDE